MAKTIGEYLREKSTPPHCCKCGRIESTCSDRAVAVVCGHCTSVVGLSGEGEINREVAVAKAKAATVQAKQVTHRAKGGIMNWAAEVLAEAGTPLSCAELAKRMIDSGKWQTTGKTPDATISSGLGQDIKNNGTTSRFRKVGPGTYGLNPAVK
jgi:hypothetical protein